MRALPLCYTTWPIFSFLSRTPANDSPPQGSKAAQTEPWTDPASLSCFYYSGSKEDVALNATNLSRFDSSQKRIILTILILRDQRRHISGYTLAWGLQRIAG